MSKDKRSETRLTWSTVVHRLEKFLDVVHARRDADERIKVAWFSTFNARCGIASYSESVLEHFNSEVFDVTIFADNLARIGSDPDNLERVWDREKPNLQKLSRRLIKQKFDIAFFQFHYAFFDLQDLGLTIERLEDSGVDVYVTFHRAKEVRETGGKVRSISDQADHFKRATGIFVQSIADLNLLKSYGLTDNVALLSLGIVDQPILKFSTVRAALGIPEKAIVIASSGFLLPGKGIPELAVAFGKIAERLPDARLLLANADYGHEHSDGEIKRVQEIVQDLNLSSKVALITDFLSLDQMHLLLSAADVVVYPYQSTDEPTSAAIRSGFSSGRPVMCTPLPVFEDVATAAVFLPGIGPEQMADGIIELLTDDAKLDEARQRSQAWRGQHIWPKIVERLSNILIGRFQERRNVEVVVPNGAKCLDRIIENSADPKEMGPKLYRSLLGREPGPAATPRFRAAQSHNFVRSQMSAIVSSDEFAAKVFDTPSLLTNLNVSVVDYDQLASMDDTEFVEQCFDKILGRKPVESEREAYLLPLRDGKYDKFDVVEALLESEEYKTSCVPVYFV